MAHELYAWTPQEAQIIKSAWNTETGRHALQLIVERVAAVDQLAFDPQSDRQSAFNDGRRYVGLSLAEAIKKPLNKAEEGKDEDDTRGRSLTATERAEQYSAAAGRTGGGRAGRQR